MSAAVSDLAALALVVIALYLTECAVFARHGAVVVSSPWFWSRHRMRTLSKALGTKGGAFALLNPLPPFGRVYVVEPWPFSLSSDGVLAFRSFALDQEPRPLESAVRFAWSEITSVDVDDKALLVNGAPFAKCSSKRHCQAAASVLRAVHAAGADARGVVIDTALDAHLDAAPVRATVAIHEQWGAPAALAASALFVSLFVAVPQDVHAHGLERWPVLVAGVYTWVVVIAVLAYLAHRGLSRGERAERWATVLLMLPAPTMAMRVNDKLGRHQLAGSHPIAAALALLEKGARDDVVGRGLRDLTHPRALPALDDMSARIEGAFRSLLLQKTSALARAAGVDVDAALTVAAHACPRCRTVYRAAGVCGDCGVSHA